MKIPLVVWLLQGLPEAIGIAALMYSVAGLGFRWRSLLPVGVLFGVTFYLVRWLPISFGIHTLLNFLFTIVVFRKATSCSLALAIRSGLAALATVVIGETVFLPLFVWASKLNLEEIYGNIWLRALSGWPNVLLLFLVATLATKIHNKRLKREPGV